MQLLLWSRPTLPNMHHYQFNEGGENTDSSATLCSPQIAIIATERLVKGQ